MKTKTWIILVAAVFVVCAALSVLLLLPKEAAFAQVYSDGQLLHTLDLRIDCTVTVETEAGGKNVITVRGGKIAVTQATCPDGYCMDRGFCSGGAHIVCLPNRMVIQFTGASPIDAVAG